MRKALMNLFWMLPALACASSAGAQFRRKSQPLVSANFRIQELAPGVWVALHNDNYGKAICNAGIIDLGSHTLVFDPFMNPQAASELKQEARRLTRKPVSFVVNSHHHHDHTRGNQVFLPNARIISSAITRARMATVHPEEQEWERRHAPTLLQALRKRMASASTADRDELPYWIGYYEGLVESTDQLHLTLPDQVFEDSLWIEGSSLSVKLVERRNGHTESDVVLLIPSLGIAFMGDLLSVGRHPWLTGGDTEGWRESLRVFYEDTLYHTYVPGHGPPAGKEGLRDLYFYLGEIQRMALEACADTSSAWAPSVLDQPIPYPYNTWRFGRFYQPNLQYQIRKDRMREELERAKRAASDSFGGEGGQ